MRPDHVFYGPCWSDNGLGTPLSRQIYKDRSDVDTSGSESDDSWAEGSMGGLIFYVDVVFDHSQTYAFTKELCGNSKSSPLLPPTFFFAYNESVANDSSLQIA